MNLTVDFLNKTLTQVNQSLDHVKKECLQILDDPHHTRYICDISPRLFLKLEEKVMELVRIRERLLVMLIDVLIAKEKISKLECQIDTIKL